MTEKNKTNFQRWFMTPPCPGGWWLLLVFIPAWSGAQPSGQFVTVALITLLAGWGLYIVKKGEKVRADAANREARTMIDLIKDFVRRHGIFVSIFVALVAFYALRDLAIILDLYDGQLGYRYGTTDD